MVARSARIAVVGGGIGGLTASLALQKLGFKVSIYERSRRLSDQGAGVTMAPNATRPLHWLGLGPALERTACSPPVSTYRHFRTAAVLRRIERSGSEARYGAPHLRMHRWDLQEALVSAVRRNDPGALHLNAAVRHVEPAEKGVKLAFADAPPVEADVVVAADGIRSVVREQLFQPKRPEFTGFVAWRGLVPTVGLAPELLHSVVSFGGGRLVNRYPVRRGELINFAAFARQQAWEAEGWTIPASLDELMGQFAEFDGQTRAVLARTPSDRLFRWGLFGREPLEGWVRGHVALLGDAAHPMLPFMGQGAAMAIEDGVVLARALDAEEHIPAALARYQAARLERVGHVAERSANQARMYHGDPEDYDLSTDQTDKPTDLFTYDATATPV